MKSYGIRNGVRPTITTAEEGTIALTAPDKGAIFYNTDTDSLRTWDGSAFQNVGGSGGEKDFVATGTIGAGAVVGLKADGTVEVVTDTVTPGSFGSSQSFDTTQNWEFGATYDVSANRIIVCYVDLGNSYYGTVRVGTISGLTITFGAATVFNAAKTYDPTVVYDTPSGQIVISYEDEGNLNYGTAIVGTTNPSTNLISFGTPVVFASSNIENPLSIYDTVEKRVVIAYYDGSVSKVIIGQVVGQSVNFGTPVTYLSANGTYWQSMVYHPVEKVIALVFSNGATGNMICGIVNGTTNSIAFGSVYTFLSLSIQYTSIAYNPLTNRCVLFYRENTGSNGNAIVATIVGTVPSFGTILIFGNTSNCKIMSEPNTNKVHFFYQRGTTPYPSERVVATIDPTNNSVSVGSAISINASNSVPQVTVFDPVANSMALLYTQSSNTNSLVASFDEVTTNVASTIGINTTAKVNAETATVTILAGTSGGHSALVIGDICYVNYQGTITQTLPVDAFGYKRLGIAVSATEILLDLLPTAEDIFTGSATEIQLADGSVLATGADGEALNSVLGVPTWGTPIPPPVLTAPSIRSVVTATGTGANLQITPGTKQAGDFMMLMAITNYSSASYAQSTLAGWTKHITGGTNYARSVIFYKVSDGTESQLTISSTGSSSGTYQHPSAILVVLKNCNGIDTFGDDFNDATSYTTKVINGIYGTGNSLELCFMASGSSSGSTQVGSISGTGWTNAANVQSGVRFYWSNVILAMVNGGSPAISPNNVTYNTSQSYIRQQSMFRLLGAYV